MTAGPVLVGILLVNSYRLVEASGVAVLADRVLTR